MSKVKRFHHQLLDLERELTEVLGTCFPDGGARRKVVGGGQHIHPVWTLNAVGILDNTTPLRDTERQRDRQHNTERQCPH